MKKNGFKIGIYINGRGADPGTMLDFWSVSVPFLASTQKLFHLFYKEIESGPPPSSVKSKNLFLALAENIAQTLMIISCCVCGVTKMGEQQPWEAKESDPQRPFNSSGEFKKTRVGIWHLNPSIAGKNCLELWGPIFNIPVGRVTCLGQRYYNATTHTSDWWGNTNYTEPNPHPLASFPNLKTRRDDLSTEGHWPAPEGLLCGICGANAHSILPAIWSGGMLVGDYPPLLFLLPLVQCESLGIPVYKDKVLIKKCRYLWIGNWKDDKCPPECIILHYGPANCTEDGS